MSDATIGSTAALCSPDWSGVRPILHIPLALELAITALTTILALAGLYYAIHLARKEGRLNPIFILAGGTIAILYEPLGDLMAHVTYHEQQISVVRAYGFQVPFWMVGAYTIAVGVPVIWLIDMIRGGITLKKWMIVFFLCTIGAMAFEIPLIFLGAIEYYGPQPFAILGYPVWMAFTNATGLFFVPATIIYLLTEKGVINKSNAFLLIPFTPMIAAGSHVAAGFAHGYNMNEGPQSLVVINLVALLSIGLAIMAVWICGTVITRYSAR